MGCPILRNPPGKPVREEMCQIVVGRKRKGERVGEPGVKQMGEAKEIEVPTLARCVLPSKGTRQVGPIRKEWAREIPLKYS